MATYIIDTGFKRQQFGYGSAVSVILFVICWSCAAVSALRAQSATSMER
jgi:ABC-type sugar transport system permease subunit